jgi:ferredoxin
MLVNLLLLALLLASCSPGRVSGFTITGSFMGSLPGSRRSLNLNVDNDHVSAEEKQQFDFLVDIASKLKLEIFDLEEGIYGYDSKDNQYGLEVIQTSIDLPAQVDAGLGLVLTEMAHSSDGRGLVLVSEVSGNAARANPPIHVGDAITGIKAGHKFRERVTGSNYDVMVDVIDQAKEIALKSGENRIALELNRMVKRAHLNVEIDDGVSSTTVEALAGENLRRLLMRRGIQVYDRKTKRFDMPFASGDCAGEGLCGTCLVQVEQGGDLLSPMDDTEKLIMKGRPQSWRASCRTVVGGSNEGGTIKISTHPQSRFQVSSELGCRRALHHFSSPHDMTVFGISQDELDPGVRSLDP